MKYLQKESEVQFRELAEKLKLKIATKLIAEEEEAKLKEKKYAPADSEDLIEEPKDLVDEVIEE